MAELGPTETHVHTPEQVAALTRIANKRRFGVAGQTVAMELPILDAEGRPTGQTEFAWVTEVFVRSPEVQRRS